MSVPTDEFGVPLEQIRVLPNEKFAKLLELQCLLLPLDYETAHLRRFQYHRRDPHDGKLLTAPLLFDRDLIRINAWRREQKLPTLNTLSDEDRVYIREHKVTAFVHEGEAALHVQ